MLLWAGILLIIAGLGCMRIDRRAAHYFYDHIGGSLLKFLRRTTHLAKAAHWLTVSVLVPAATAAGLSAAQAGPTSDAASKTATEAAPKVKQRMADPRL